MNPEQIQIIREAAETIKDGYVNKHLWPNDFDTLDKLIRSLRQLADDAEKRYHEQEAERHMAAKEEKCPKGDYVAPGVPAGEHKYFNGKCVFCNYPEPQRIEKLAMPNEFDLKTRNLTPMVFAKINELCDVINSREEANG